MSLYWYNTPRYGDRPPEEVAELLAPLGITIRKTIGHVTYFVDDETGQVMKSIGDVIVRTASGAIEVWPYGGVQASDLRVLLGSAEEAFRRKPCRAELWYFERRARGRSYWRCSVSIPASPDDPVAVLVARAERSVEIATDLERARAVELA